LIQKTKMNSTTVTSLWSEIKTKECSFQYYPKEGVTWEQMNQWLETEWSASHWTWRGFGEVGTEGYFVTVIRLPCSKRCECVCEECGNEWSTCEEAEECCDSDAESEEEEEEEEEEDEWKHTRAKLLKQGIRMVLLPDGNWEQVNPE
jgi:hypothetical protein